MATERLSMRRTREILRQRPALGRAHRAIGASVGLGVSTVGSTVRRAAAAKLTWPEIEALGDGEMEARLYPAAHAAAAPVRGMPNWAVIHAERRRPGVTMELLHLEYLQREPSRQADVESARASTTSDPHSAGATFLLMYSPRHQYGVSSSAFTACQSRLRTASISSMPRRGPGRLAIVIASPELFRVTCQTPKQMAARECELPADKRARRSFVFAMFARNFRRRHPKHPRSA